MENKKENFTRISGNRTEKIITILKQLGNLVNTSYYDYTKDDIELIFSQIERETAQTKNKLLNNLDKIDREIEL